MKITLLITWLLAPVFLAAYHYGPGKDAMKRDDAAAFLRKAGQSGDAKDYAAVVAAYDKALEALPEQDNAAARRLRLARAKARMQAHQLPLAHDELEALFKEMSDDPARESAVLDETSAALANSKYYLTWLMRLEGLPREEWEPEIESSRQHFRHLAESAEKSGDTVALATHQKDLEASIKLARMDLTELQGLPLPSQ